MMANSPTQILLLFILNLIMLLMFIPIQSMMFYSLKVKTFQLTKYIF